MAGTALSQDDIHVTIEGDDNPVETDRDGNIAIHQPDGGVVVQLNPQKREDAEADEDPQKFYANLCDRIGDGELLQLANELMEAVQADDTSRSEWLANYADNMAILGLKKMDPKAGDGASAVDGQSVVVNPLLLEGVLKGWANAQAELLPAEGPCKIANYSDQPSEIKDELAEAYGRDMNYYLTTTAVEFAPQTSHMLLWGTYFSGSGFKKVYTHPIKRRPYSEAVSPDNLIVSDAAKDFDECERITHVIKMRQSVMKRYMAKGIFRQIALTPPTDEANQVDEAIASTQGVAVSRERPEDIPYTLWETQCELDLDQFAPKEFKGKGIPLPYLVTMDKDSQVILSIRRDWKPEDEDCGRKKMYVKYPYVPGPGFYGTGLSNILGNASDAMTAAWRICLDNGFFANFPAGMIDKLAGRQNTSNLRASPGELLPVETGGRKIGDVVAPFPFKDVSPGMMQLVQQITEQAKAVGGAPDIPVGEGMQNVPVGTMLAHIEQATKVMAAAHKGQHRAMDEELELIADLFRENPEAFWKGNKKAKGYWNVEKLLAALDQWGLTPKSDPNVPSHIHRLMIAVALTELMGTPLGALLDPNEVLRRVLVAMRVDPIGLMKPPNPNPQPDPNMLTAMAKVKAEDNKAAKNQIDAQEVAQKPELEKIQADASIKGKTVDLAKALITHQGDREDAHHQRQMDLANLARDTNKDAIEATKTTADAITSQQEAKNKHQEGQLAVAQHLHQREMDHRSHGLAAAQTQHQMGLQTRDADRADRELGVKAQTESAKTGIAQQQADTATHTALHPPKPAGPKKKR